MRYRPFFSIIILANLFLGISPLVFADPLSGNTSTSTATPGIPAGSNLHVTQIGRVSISNLHSLPLTASKGLFVVPFHPRDPVSYATDKNRTTIAQSTTSFAKIMTVPSTLTRTSSSTTTSMKIYQEFNGIDSTGSSCACAPPDVELATGPNHVVENVNTEEEIWAKNGTVINSFSLSSFYSTSDTISDPRILFDAISGRWFSSILDITANSVWLAVSATSDPTSLWTIYDVSFGGDCPDQPYIGVSNDKLVISGNDFGPQCGGSFLGAQYAILDKNALLTGSPSPASQFFGPNLSEFAVRPVQNLGSNSTLFMVSDDGTTSANLYLYKVDGTVPAATIQKTTLLVNTINTPLSATQLGTTILLDTGDSRIEDAVWNNQKIWLALNDGCTPSGDATTRSCVRLIELNATKNTILQDFDIAKSGYYLFYPSIKIDSNATLNVVYGNSSSNNYPNIMFAVQKSTDPVDTVETPQLLTLGNSPVTVAVTNNAARYGDYFGSGLDPSNPLHVWMAGEYVPSSAVYWGTFIGSTNAVPVANAGSSQTVTSGSTVTLSGIASSDPDGDSLSYSWTQTVGPVVTLSNTTSPTPSFVAPTVTSNTLLTFKLVVNDGIVSSNPSTVSITVTPSTCGVSLSQTTITYGTVNPGATPVNATNNPTGLSNTGSTTATLTVSGGNWTSGGSTVFILANKTAFATSPITSSVTPTHLNLNGNVVTISSNFAGMSTIQTYWQLIPKLFQATAGALTQSLTFATSC